MGHNADKEVSRVRIYMDTIRFIQQFKMGYGDYTRERHEWLNHYTAEEIAQEIQMLRDSNEASSTEPRVPAREGPHPVAEM
ncbi:MAG: hypothetical protein K8R89_07240 [Anaerolineae bacterium]|nr:hypothetical protein [Anaerolineae bacterium]